jgi:hypothetical protein
MSNIKLNFSNVETDDGYKGRMTPGIHDVEIISVSEDTNNNGNEYISVIMSDSADTMEHEERMFVTDRGMKGTLKRLAHLFESIFGKDKFPRDNVSVEQLNQALAGKKLRVKFGAEEYEGQDGLRLKTRIPYLNFAESLSVQRESSRLTYDPARDIKRVSAAPKESAPQAAITPPLDLGTASAEPMSF